MYTFSDQLTTDQKLAHIKEWIAASEARVKETAPSGPRPHQATYKDEAERLRMLEEWHHLVLVEEELVVSKADGDDPFGDQVQEAWCRMTRLQLRIAGIRLQLRAEQAKPRPSTARIERLRTRMTALADRLSRVQGHAESRAYSMAAETFAEFECEGEGCTEEEPCTPCACRAALAAAES